MGLRGFCLRARPVVRCCQSSGALDVRFARLGRHGELISRLILHSIR